MARAIRAGGGGGWRLAVRFLSSVGAERWKEESGNILSLFFGIGRTILLLKKKKKGTRRNGKGLILYTNHSDIGLTIEDERECIEL